MILSPSLNLWLKEFHESFPKRKRIFHIQEEDVYSEQNKQADAVQFIIHVITPTHIIEIKDYNKVQEGIIQLLAYTLKDNCTLQKVLYVFGLESDKWKQRK
jgi:CRISPR/Cas system endoribonuclease Cas6 (RAMP superfamily)